MINWEKHNIDISKVRNGKTFCPKCHEGRRKQSERELSVDVTRGLFNCHHCEFKGSAYVNDIPKKEYVKPQGRVQNVSDKAVEWFKARGISNNTLTRFKISEAMEYVPQVAKERNCILFNYFRKDELVNIKFRDGAKNFKMVKDAELIFYNLDAIENETECYITEGEIDTLSLYECGIYNAVSVPNGASKGNNRLEYLDNCIEYFDKMQKIFILTDGDEPGLALRDELCRRLGKERCWLVRYPENTKDANDVLRYAGKPGIEELIANAYQYPIEGIEQVDDIDSELMNLYHNGYPFGVGCGYLNFDQHITFRKSELTTITGSPGSGKSTFLNNIIVRLAAREKWRIAMFSPEKQPTEILSAELAEIFTGKRFYSSITEDKLSLTELADAKNFIRDHFWFMKIDEIDVTIDGILDKCKELVLRKGINCLVIDPWNYVEHKVPHGYTETQYISEELTKIKRFKDRYGVHIFLVAHPRKLNKNKEGKYDVPSLYDIAGSAHFFNKTDNGIVLQRDFEGETTNVFIQKIRWSFVGKLGDVCFQYHIPSKRFAEQNMPFERQYYITQEAPF